MSNFTVLLAGFSVSLMSLIGFQLAYTPTEHIQSWSEAVWNGNIDGDPAYYYDGLAAADEYYHALITATNTIKADQWVQPNADADEANPASFCEHQMWEYRDTPGNGYWPQLFADTYVYDSLTVFDDFYGPVTYLDP